MNQPATIETLERQKAFMAEAVANGESIQEAGRQLGVNRGRACKIWRRIREELGAQAV